MDECLHGRCYYCGRDLLSAVALPQHKQAALSANRLTCGPCVHVHGRPPWRRDGSLRRWMVKRRLQGWKPGNARKTHCAHGHEFTPENTWVHHGKRHCRTCWKKDR